MSTGRKLSYIVQVLDRIDEREQRRIRAQWRARHAMIIDMAKSYAGPLLIVGYINPVVAAGGASVRLGPPNYAVLMLGLALAAFALTFVPGKE